MMGLLRAGGHNGETEREGKNGKMRNVTFMVGKWKKYQSNILRYLKCLCVQYVLKAKLYVRKDVRKGILF